MTDKVTRSDMQRFLEIMHEPKVRNQDFAEYLLSRFVSVARAYEQAATKCKFLLAAKHGVMLDRLRNVLNNRYNVGI